MNKRPDGGWRRLCCVPAGDTQFAGVQHGSWMQAWRRFGWLPELFDISIATRHPLEKVCSRSHASSISSSTGWKSQRCAAQRLFLVAVKKSEGGKHF